MIRRFLWVLLIASSAMSTLALAGEPKEKHNNRNPGGQSRSWIPEFDPAAAGTIAAIVVGGVVIVSRRRNR